MILSTKVEHPGGSTVIPVLGKGIQEDQEAKTSFVYIMMMSLKPAWTMGDFVQILFKASKESIALMNT